MTGEDREVYARARELAEIFTGMPAYLCDDDVWYAAVEEARAELKIPERAPVCRHCGSVAPYGDERNSWLSVHQSDIHRWYWNLKRKAGKLLCRYEFHKHPKSTAPSWWTCERDGCRRTFHQKW